MPRTNKEFRTFLVSLADQQRKKAVITVVLTIILLIITVGITVSSVESVTNAKDDKTRVHQLVNKVGVSTYKNVLKSEMKVLGAKDRQTASYVVGRTSYGTSYHLVSFISKLFTGIEINNLQSILYQEIPGFSVMAAELIGERSQLDIYAPPVEIAPTDHLFIDTEDPKPADPEKPKEDPKRVPNGQNKLQGKPPILIYHTHNREAYLPELNNVNRANEAYHSSTNITLVGKHLSDELEALGVPTIVSTRDYWSELPAGEYWKSYVYSKKEVESILAKHDWIPFVFDIHRDSANRSRTTVTHDGQQYAAVWFIIGQLNPTWQFNYQFAAKIEAKMEQKIPGISRGIWAKKSGQYNQDLSHQSVLIEIGGVDNNLEEAKRTAAILAPIIAELYWEEIDNR